MPGKHKVIGFDPGSLNWKACVLDDDGVIASERLLTKTVSTNPTMIGDMILRHRDGLDAIAAPSGHGLPLTTLDRVDERDLRLMTLKEPGESIVGLEKVIEVLRGTQEELKIPCYVLPAVKHLRTVPRWRKLNRIDLGTSDKLCSAAFALQTQAERSDLPYDEVSFLLIEVGSAFVSVISVDRGTIVDGIGGTGAGFGTKATGCMDAELTHVLRFGSKADVYTGGLVDVAGLPLDILEREVSRELEERPLIALERFLESLCSDAAAIACRTGVGSCILSSVLGPGLNDIITSRLENYGMEILPPVDGAKSAATGAAYLVNGLIQGRYRRLLESLDIAGSAGSVLDDIYLKAGLREV